MYVANLQNIGGARRQLEAASVTTRMGDLGVCLATAHLAGTFFTLAL